MNIAKSPVYTAKSLCAFDGGAVALVEGTLAFDRGMPASVGRGLAAREGAAAFAKGAVPFAKGTPDFAVAQRDFAMKICDSAGIGRDATGKTAVSALKSVDSVDATPGVVVRTAPIAERGTQRALRDRYLEEVQRDPTLILPEGKYESQKGSRRLTPPRSRFD